MVNLEIYDTPRYHDVGALPLIYSQLSLSLSKGIIAYKCTSHSSNTKTWPCIGLLTIHFKWPWVHEFGVFKTKSNVKPTQEGNIQVAYYFKVFMLDEWWARSHTMVSFPKTRLRFKDFEVTATCQKAHNTQHECSL